MQVQTIESGSKGNCTIVLTTDTKIIIDIGISFITLKKTLLDLNLDISHFTAILITHNHNDHIKGLKSLISHTDIKVYIPKEMYPSLEDIIPRSRCVWIDDEYYLNDLKIELIHTSHDALYSVGYIIEQNEDSLVYVTDTGYINRKFLSKMENKGTYIIESNYDEIMLMDGPYPRFLKERVISDTGHLSNKTTAKYLKKIIGPNTKNIILAHLSETNNTEEKVLEAINDLNLNKNINIIIAKQKEVGPLVEV